LFEYAERKENPRADDEQHFADENGVIAPIGKAAPADGITHQRQAEAEEISIGQFGFGARGGSARPRVAHDARRNGLSHRSCVMRGQLRLPRLSDCSYILRRDSANTRSYPSAIMRAA